MQKLFIKFKTLSIYFNYYFFHILYYFYINILYSHTCFKFAINVKVFTIIKLAAKENKTARIKILDYFKGNNIILELKYETSLFEMCLELLKK